MLVRESLIADPVKPQESEILSIDWGYETKKCSTWEPNLNYIII